MMSSRPTRNIVVLGMHRSGTSVVMNLLRAAGCYIGSDEDLLVANDANQKGYGERFDVVNTNKLILESAGLDWMSANELDVTTIPDSLKKEISLKVKGLIKDLDQHGIWAIKDPRLCITLPLWKEHLSEALIIICHRSPIEVAKSLHVRNGLPISVGYALWEIYTKSLISYSTGYERILVNYQDLILTPELETNRLISWLIERSGIGINRLDSQQIEKIISPDLYRQRSIHGEDLSLLSQDQRELLIDLSKGVIPDFSVRDDGYDLSHDILALFNERRDLATKCKEINQEKEVVIARQQDQKQERDNRIIELKEAVQEKEAAITRQQDQKQERDNRIIELKEAVQEKEVAITRQQNQKQERDNRIIELKEIVREKEAVIRQYMRENYVLKDLIKDYQELIDIVNELTCKLDGKAAKPWGLIFGRKEVMKLLKKIFEMTRTSGNS